MQFSITALRATAPVVLQSTAVPSRSIGSLVRVLGPTTIRSFRSNHLRSFSSDASEEGKPEPPAHSHVWPIQKWNTILNICPEGETMVVERLGSLHSVRKSGWFLTVPLIDRIAYRVNMRERTLSYPPQSAITKDNVTIEVNAVLFVQFVDAQRAAYGAADPLLAVTELAKSSMRSVVGELELDDVFHMRKTMNQLVVAAVAEPATKWGIVVLRHEILDVKPDEHISEAMDKQAAAERLRRERVLAAEGDKQAAALQSEGVKIQLRNESEGKLIAARNAAEAERSKLVAEAKGRAEAMIAEADARRKALAVLGEALRAEGGTEAATLEMGREYVRMYGAIGQKSNTLMVNERPADLTALMLQAATAVRLGGVDKVGEPSGATVSRPAGGYEPKSVE